MKHRIAAANPLHRAALLMFTSRQFPFSLSIFFFQPFRRCNLRCRSPADTLAGVNLAHSEIGALSVTNRTGFAEWRGHLESVSGGSLPIVTTKAGRSGRSQRRVKFSRRQCLGHAGGGRQLVRVIHVALGAVAAVT